MKTLIALVSFLVLSSAVIAQKKDCNIWLGSTPDSIDAIKKAAEDYLNLKLNPASADASSKTLYEYADEKGIGSLKIWMKQKKSYVGSDLVTTYSVSSLKLTGPADNIDALMTTLKTKVADCGVQAADNSFVFGTTKVYVEKAGGDWSKKNVPISTMTITAK